MGEQAWEAELGANPDSLWANHLASLFLNLYLWGNRGRKLTCSMDRRGHAHRACARDTNNGWFSSPLSLSLSKEEAIQFPVGEAKFAWHYVLKEIFL